MDGSQQSAYRASTAADDLAQATTYGQLNGFWVVYLGIVTSGAFPGNTLQGQNDFALMSANVAGTITFAVISRPGEIRINDVTTMEDGTPVFAGAANVDPSDIPQTDYQAYAFQVLNGWFVAATYWDPQAGGASEAFGIGSRSANVYMTTTRAIFPQPVGWQYVKLARYNSGLPVWQSTWTAASNYKPNLAITPEEDVYVRTANVLTKAAHDTVHFSETQPTWATMSTLRGSEMIGIDSVGAISLRTAR